MNRRWLAIAPLLGLSVWLPPALAQEPKRVSSQELARLGFFQDFDELDLEDLLTADEPMVSLASRQQQTRTDAAGVVTVVDEMAIRNLGATTLREVLRTLPGLDVVTDNLGRDSIVVRGLQDRTAGAASVLVLLDGLPLREGTGGGATAINLDFPLTKAKKIEILRGPGSALFGAEALAAVINIVTYSPEEATGISVRAAGGSFGATQISLRLASPLKDFKLVGFVHFDDVDGAQLEVPADAQTTLDRASPDRQPASLAPSRTRDARRTLESLYRITYKGFGVDWRLMQTGSDGFVGPADTLGLQNDLSGKQHSLSGSYRHGLGANGSIAGRVSWVQNQADYLLELAPPNSAVALSDGTVTLPSGLLVQTSLNTRRYGAEVALDRTLPGGHQFLAGLSLEREATWGLEVDGNYDFRSWALLSGEGLQPLPGAVQDATRNVVAGFVQDRREFTSPDLAITAGLRVDRLSDLSSVFSPRLGAVWTLPRGFTLKALYGRGFRPPSFSDLHFDLPGLRSNPELEPMVTDTVDALLLYKNRDWEFSVGAFTSQVHDPILPEGPLSIAQPPLLINGADVDLRGIELEARGVMGPHVTFLNFTAQRPEDTDTGEPVAGVPRFQATLGTTLLFADRWSVTPVLILRSGRPRAPGDERGEVPGYALVDLAFRGRTVLKKLDVGGTIRNLFDKEYFDPSPAGGVPGDYPRPGRAILIHAEYQF